MINTDPRRGFGIADALILVAASALAWLDEPHEWTLVFPNESQARYYLKLSQMVGTAFAVTWGIGVMAMRLRPPRPASKQWRHGPGFIACATASAGCLFQFLLIGVWYAMRGESLWPGNDIIESLLDPAASAVLGGWLTLGLAGLWKREQTWVDDLGIAVGLSWLGLWVIRSVGFYL